MPRPFPKEFREDVIAVARKSEASVASVARDFGISESCLNRWLNKADAEDGFRRGDRPGSGARPVADSDEVRELKKRNRQLEQEVEILRRAAAYFAKDIAPK